MSPPGGGVQDVERADALPFQSTHLAQLSIPEQMLFSARTADAFDAAWAAGQALSLEQAIAEACGEPAPS